MTESLGFPCTEGTLLGGRLRYAQPVEGYRTGLEPVLIAASIPASPGEAVVEAGSGAGAGLLALAARVPGIGGLGLERDPAMARLGCANVAANGLAGLRVIAADITSWRPDRTYDHAFANPPWHNAAGTPSPVPGRRAAKVAPAGTLANWAAALAAALRPRGSLSLILPAADLASGMSALLNAACGEVALYPFWPHYGEAARLILLRGLKGGRGACRVSAGMVLHEANGSFTAAARAVLEGGEKLTF